MKPLPAAAPDQVLQASLEDLVAQRTLALQQQVQQLSQLNHALAQSHSFLRGVLETTIDGFWRMDETGQLLEVNPTYCRLSQYAADELLRMRISDLEAIENQDETQVRLQRLLSSGHEQFETVHRRKDGSLWDVEVSTSRHIGETVTYYAFLRDITNQKQHQQALERVAHFDPLTQLPNRNLLADRLGQKLAHGSRTHGMVAVCLLDLDGFKQVNDQLGHKAGDQLLREVAKRLQECIRQEDTAARLGGDEFVLLLGDMISVTECQQALDRILQAIAAPYQVVGQLARVSCSIGVALYPNEGSDPDLLLRHADQAMYRAKTAGKNRYFLFDPSHELHAKARSGTVLKIAKAMAAGQFQMHYQPKLDLRQCKILGFEALVRWQHPILGQMTPGEFVPLIEQEDLVVSVGEWVMHTVLHQQANWLQQGQLVPVSINVSTRQLLDKGFVMHLSELLARHPMALHPHISMDVSESTALEDVAAVSSVIEHVRNLHLSVALDDFGTGYSSLMHLKRLRTDELKIDKTFIANMQASAQDLAMVQSVIALGNLFGRQVSAEGVESQAQLHLLSELGCHVVQGFVVARPMPANQVLPWWQYFTPDALTQGLPALQPGPNHDFAVHTAA